MGTPPGINEQCEFEKNCGVQAIGNSQLIFIYSLRRRRARTILKHWKYILLKAIRGKTKMLCYSYRLIIF